MRVALPEVATTQCRATATLADGAGVLLGLDNGGAWLVRVRGEARGSTSCVPIGGALLPRSWTPPRPFPPVQVSGGWLDGEGMSAGPARVREVPLAPRLGARGRGTLELPTAARFVASDLAPFEPGAWRLVALTTAPGLDGALAAALRVTRGSAPLLAGAAESRGTRGRPAGSEIPSWASASRCAARACEPSRGNPRRGGRARARH